MRHDHRANEILAMPGGGWQDSRVLAAPDAEKTDIQDANRCRRGQRQTNCIFVFVRVLGSKRIDHVLMDKFGIRMGQRVTA